jgi:tRNA threonylcarbamoyladenosine biosynthesis protein TsaB
MLLLAADTSGKHGSIALAKCEGNDCSVLEIVPITGGTFSAQLVPQIAALLSKHGFSKNEIDGFAVASGPGSFTGLRVGLAAIKGLAEVLRKPIAALSLLEVLAMKSEVQGSIVAVLDAGRNEVYAGNYEHCAGSVRLIAETLVPRAEFLNQGSQLTVITPDAAIADELKSRGTHVIEVDPINSEDVARMGWKKIQTGQTVSPEELEANYIRRSDAEILSSSR